VRLTQTGTGRGQVVGTARIDFHAQQDRTVRSGAVSWDGDALFVPLLAGLAFDQYYPNLRCVPRGVDAPLIGKDAQQATLDQFEEWADEARDAHDAAFRARCKEIHPDLQTDSTTATDDMIRLNNAWEILRSERMRAAYDWLQTERVPT
jgi:DnaJ domain